MLSSSLINNTMGTLLDYTVADDACADISTRISMYSEAVKEYEFILELGGQDSSKEDALMTEAGGILEAIGTFVMNLVKKLKLLVQKFFDNFKSQRALDKEAEDIVSVINKRNPGVGKKLYQAYNSGRAKLCDLRRMKELDTGFDEVLKFARDKSSDPKTLREKINEYKTRISEFTGSDVIAAAGVAGTLAANANHVVKIGTWIKNSISNISKYEKNAERGAEAVLSAYKAIQSDTSKNAGKTYLDVHSLSKQELLQNLYAYYNKEYADMIKAEAGSIAKLEKEVAALQTKYADAKNPIAKSLVKGQLDKKTKEIKSKTDESIGLIHQLNEDKRLDDLRNKDNSKGKGKA